MIMMMETRRSTPSLPLTPVMRIGHARRRTPSGGDATGRTVTADASQGSTASASNSRSRHRTAGRRSAMARTNGWLSICPNSPSGSRRSQPEACRSQAKIRKSDGAQLPVSLNIAPPNTASSFLPATGRTAPARRRRTAEHRATCLRRASCAGGTSRSVDRQERTARPRVAGASGRREQPAGAGIGVAQDPG